MVEWIGWWDWMVYLCWFCWVFDLLVCNDVWVMLIELIGGGIYSVYLEGGEMILVCKVVLVIGI